MWSMPPITSPPLGSLASVRVGDRAIVREIFFDAVRDRCRASGVITGSAVRCKSASGKAITVVAADGQSHTLDRFTAEFVAVDVLHSTADPEQWRAR